MLLLAILMIIASLGWTGCLLSLPILVVGLGGCTLWCGVHTLVWCLSVGEGSGLQTQGWGVGWRGRGGSGGGGSRWSRVR